MNRALPLLLLAAAIAAGLGFFALQGPAARAPLDPEAESPTVSADDRATARKAPARAAESSSESGLAAIQADRKALEAEIVEGMPVQEWEVIPMNERGQLIGEATITATRGSTTLEGVGRTSFYQVPSGTWDIVVKAQDLPDWVSRVQLQPGPRVRTTPKLGDSFRVRGEVVDTNGTPVARSHVFLLPKGTRHPTQIDLRSRAAKNREAGRLDDGVIIATTSPTGSFEFRVSEPGEYRVSVGDAGEVRWTEKKGTELHNGGPSYLLVTVPAKAQLTVTFAGTEAERAAQITAYAFDPELAARIAAQESERSYGGGGADADAAGVEPNSIEEMQRAAKEQALKEAGSERGFKAGAGKAVEEGGARGGRRGTARSSLEENRRVADQGFETKSAGARAPLFDPGWRPVGSTRVEGAETVLSDLPGGKDLRFLFIRGRERIATLSGVRLMDGRRSIGTVNLPPPPIDPAQASTSATANLSVTLEPDSDEPKTKPGTVWSLTR